MKVFHGLNDVAQAFLQFAAVFGPGHHVAELQGKDDLFPQKFRDILMHNPLCQAFGQGRLADARLADDDRVVLGPAAQDAHHRFQFAVPSQDGIQLVLSGQLVQVTAEAVQQLQGLALLRSLLFLQGLRLELVVLRQGTRADELFVHHALDAFQRNMETAQDAASHAFRHGQDAEQHMPGADLVQAVGFRKGLRVFQRRPHLFRVRRRHLAVLVLMRHPRFQLAHEGILVHAAMDQQVGRFAVAHLEHGPEHVLRAQLVAAAPVRQPRRIQQDPVQGRRILAVLPARYFFVRGSLEGNHGPEKFLQEIPGCLRILMPGLHALCRHFLGTFAAEPLAYFLFIDDGDDVDRRLPLMTTFT